MAPSHGFAAASHGGAALRGAPATHGETAFRGAAGFREARRRDAVHPLRNPGENVILQYLSHDGRPAPAVRAAATAPLSTVGKIPAIRSYT
jgi:hypothetical protein